MRINKSLFIFHLDTDQIRWIRITTRYETLDYVVVAQIGLRGVR